MTHSCHPPSRFSLRRFGVVKVSFYILGSLRQIAVSVCSMNLLQLTPPLSESSHCGPQNHLYEVCSENIFQTSLLELALLPPRPLSS